MSQVDNVINFFCIYLIFLTITACNTQKSSEIDQLKNRLTLKFEDNFTSNTLDTSIWQTYSFNPRPYDKILPRGNCNYSNAAILTDSNCIIKNGILHLIARYDSSTYSGIVEGKIGKNTGCNYIAGEPFTFNQFITSGSIFSKEGFQNGLFECRAKIPSTSGLYPVFWLWHHDEIVVFEFFGDSNTHFISSHNKDKYVTKKFNHFDYSEDFHTYSAYWNHEKVQWFIDGKLIWEVFYTETLNTNVTIEASNTEIHNALPDTINRWLNPNLSLRIYEWANDIDITKLPDTLKIDYVHIYQN